MKIFKNFLAKQIALYEDRKPKFKYYLTICAIFRDEGRYLEEWLSFHCNLGVSHFYLYNDRSEDDYLNVLKPFIDKGLVTLKDWHNLGQSTAYNHCIKNYRMEARWIAIIDLDEFLFSPTNKNLPIILKNYEDCAAIFVYWKLFGSSGHINRPENGVIKNYTKCMDYNTALHDDFHPITKRKEYVTARAIQGKSIVNPRLVMVFKVHNPVKLWKGFLVNEKKIPFVNLELRNPFQLEKKQNFSYEVLIINHYWSKSIHELEAKVKRGTLKETQHELVLDCWKQREAMLNVVDDKSILKLMEKNKFKI